MRTDARLKQRYQAILSYTGFILLLAGVLMLTPLLTLIAWPEESIYSTGFIFPAVLLCGVGAGLWRLFRPPNTITLTVQEGGVVVLFSWISVCVVSACPFMFVQGLNFTQAVFESVSGWTTTGLSVVDVTQASHPILIWRSTMQMVGGAGLVIIMLTVIAGPAGPGLSAAEGRSEQLVPHVRKSANLVFRIYFGYILVGILAYWFAGMTPFDAINHAFCALSTGGFSTRTESIGYWDSIAIEAVTLPLMILGNLSFLTAYLFLGRKWRAVARNGEVRLFSTLVPVATLIFFLLVCRELYPTVGKQIRVAIFEAVTALSTTGYSTTSYGNWNAIGYIVLITFMFIGGGTYSTAGGMKQYRIYLLLRSLLWELRRPLLPRTAIVENYVWHGEQKDYIDDSRIREVAIFVFLYLVTLVIGVGIIAAHGYEFKESLFEFASALGTVGLSVGVTAAGAPPLVLWTETIGMFLGRLEFFVIFAGFAKIVRDLPGRA